MDNMGSYVDHVDMVISTKPIHDYRKTNTRHHVVRAVYGMSCPLYPSGVIKVLTLALQINIPSPTQRVRKDQARRVREKGRGA